MGTVYPRHRRRARARGRDQDSQCARERRARAPAAAARRASSPRLEHPGIVPIHDAGRLADGRLFYVMKRVQGPHAARAPRDVAGPAERLRLFERICEPVAFAHAQGFIHRDLKPENIMVGAFGEVMVMDWGVAKTVGSRQSSVDSHSLQSESTVPVDSRRESAVPVDHLSRQSRSKSAANSAPGPTPGP